MNITLDPDVARWVDQEARRAGVSPETYIERWLRDQRELALQFPSLPSQESALLAQINEGFSDTFWKRYRELIVRRETETLNDAEYAELIALSERIELKNAERANYLLALAQMRNLTLPELIRQLRLRPASVMPS